MDHRRDCKKFCILLLYFFIAATLFTHCDGRRSKQLFKFKGGPTLQRSSNIKSIKKLRLSNHLNVDPSLDSTNTQPYGESSPFTLAPFESLGPIPLPEANPPNCVYPPPTSSTPTPEVYAQPPPPTTSGFTPIFPNPSPPSGPTITVPNPPECYPTPIPPESGLSPPEIVVPSPPESVPSPSEYYPTPIPPESGFSPPEIVVPSPPEYEPSPPVFLPPVVYPLPNVPPPPYTAPVKRVWCVAKPTVPDPIIQEAMDYACGTGADCGSIQTDGPCFQPDTLYAHASYAFNSYWQSSKVAGGTCDFGGTAILVTMDPSYDGCHFIYY
ncbi:extensin-like isoform X2 [Telopea speciosissima]|uniref:extensin-like isoform X2 n=1 Tax=Telopea speciosissima TaxID=54955 RepID=UPI001CC34E8C|nr:extensin-like isoform X2 [Telopea speciosissima]